VSVLLGVFVLLPFAGLTLAGWAIGKGRDEFVTYGFGIALCGALLAVFAFAVIGAQS